MASRNGAIRNLSFEVLRRSLSAESDPKTECNRRKRRNRTSRRKKKLLDRSESFDPHSASFHDGGACNGFELDANSYCAGGGSVVYKEVREESECAVAAAREEEGEAPTAMRGGIEGFTFGELRQRNVSGASEDLAAASVAHDEGGTGKEDGGGVNATNPVEKATAAMHNRLCEASIIDYACSLSSLLQPPTTVDAVTLQPHRKHVKFRSAMVSFMCCFLLPCSHLTWEHTRGQSLHENAFNLLCMILWSFKSFQPLL